MRNADARFGAMALGLAALLMAAPRAAAAPAAAAAGTPPQIVEFPLPVGSESSPEGIAAGPDSALWFLENGVGRVGRITTSGVITEYSAPALVATGIFVGIVTGPDGNIWFVEPVSNAIGRITPDGVLTEFPLPTSNAIPNSVIVGPDGSLWFAEGASRKIGRITVNGSITELPVPLVGPNGLATGPDSNLWVSELNGIARFSLAGEVKEFPLPGPEPSNIVAGPDGNLWFATYKGNQIYRIRTSGEITGFTVPTPGSIPSNVTAGPDGNVWFTEAEGNKIGRITPDGVITEIPVPTPSAGPAGITTGPDGNIWFTEIGAGQIGRLTLAAATSCVPQDGTLCLDDQPGDRRWQVEVSFHTAQGGGASGSGHAIPLASLGVSHGGLFWFFGRNNPEMLLKVLNGCAANQHFWVFSSATTNVGFTVTVMDTRAGGKKTYANRDRVPAAPVQDTQAFLCP
jgi:streptogramin lyase